LETRSLSGGGVSPSLPPPPFLGRLRFVDLVGCFGKPTSRPSCTLMSPPTSPSPRKARRCSSCRCHPEVSRVQYQLLSVLSLRLHNLSLVAEVLSIPKNMKILAVPVFELYDNSARSVPVPLAFVSLFWSSSYLVFRLLLRRRYGPQLACLPHLLSRYNFVMVGNDGKATQQYT
jgi:hypothetical protein